MKDYIVFLNSGESIYGSMEDQEAERLKQAYRKRTSWIEEFADSEGIFLLDMRQVAALVFNKNFPDKIVGFNNGQEPKEE